MESFIIYSENVSSEKLATLNVYIDDKSSVASGVKIYCNNQIFGSKIMEGVILKPNNHITDSEIEKNTILISSTITDSKIANDCNIGPYTHIRGGSQIGAFCRVGNFVEIKKSMVSDHTKIAHMSYVGDAEIGKNCNIGSGVIFCNYDGKNKHKIYIGDNVFVGSNCNLIAPLTICDGAFLAAGSTITHDVNADELAIARARQVIKKNFKNPYTQTD